MIEWIIGGAVLLIGAVGKALSGSDNGTASSIGRGMENMKDSAMNKISEANDAMSRARDMSDSELKANMNKGTSLQRTACQTEYKKRNS